MSSTTFRIDKSLRPYLEIELERLRFQRPHQNLKTLCKTIILEFEAAGDASRYLNIDGKIAWKATPLFLDKSADAELEAKYELRDERF